MARYDEKSILKTRLIKNVLLNQKNYKFQDFKFKVLKKVNVSNTSFWNEERNHIEVYNFNKMILKLIYEEDAFNVQVGEIQKGKYEIEVVHFDPQTNNDCQSINHIIAVFSELCAEQHTDRGNACVINNQYVFRKKDNYYSYTKVWTKGDIKMNNYNKELSHEFATEEYINNIKKVFGFKRMPRRDLKKKIKEQIENAVSTETKRLLLENL